ncbi:phosphonate transport system permease protein [Paracoccus halophilus]|uniref:Phosphonate ABC transporter permease n=1 Tax=Paracoccus halophilus TaxID=376733 RepID=A0A099F3I1_9RHOB|nr:phosphonate ABC transporter, permease protein PhnE [Paracoccus halophilus]KGJ04838.1 phosphonate ABC transporter permease [Paracoccus halophilus]SFA51460.1 phosphonate transport system permease protein [Paracoccus halophilus]
MTSTDAPAIAEAYRMQLSRRRSYSALLWAIFALLMISGFWLADDRNAGGFWEGLPRIFDYPSELVAEAVQKAGNLPGLMLNALPALVETINIAAVATLLGGLGGGIMALLSTRGLAPWPRLVPLFRRLLDIARAIPELVIALVLIFILGGGPVPAAIAIAFHSVGALGKLFSEVAENASLKPVEGLESVGASWLLRIWFGIIPQVAPNWASYAMLRFEINIRASAILGFVGAGGIGYELRNAISWGQGRYDAAAAIFILLFATIVLFDQLTSVARNRLVRGQEQGQYGGRI